MNRENPYPLIALLTVSVLSPCSAQQTERSGGERRARPDVSKVAVEMPIKGALYERARRGMAAKRVAPGRVRWHTDFAAAKTAARKSGRPVLHFQLLGRLDEEFC